MKKNTKQNITAGVIALSISTTPLTGITNFVHGDSNKPVKKQELSISTIKEANSVPYSYFVKNVGTASDGFTSNIKIGDETRLKNTEMVFSLNSNAEIIKVRALFKERFREDLSVDKIMKNLDQFKKLVVDKGVPLLIECGVGSRIKLSEHTEIVKLNNNLIGVKKIVREQWSSVPDSEKKTTYYLYNMKGENVTNKYNLNDKVKSEIDNLISNVNKNTLARAPFVAMSSEGTQASFKPVYNMTISPGDEGLSEKSLAKLLDTTKRNAKLSFYSHTKSHSEAIKDCDGMESVNELHHHSCGDMIIEYSPENKTKKSLLDIFTDKKVYVDIKHNDSQGYNIKKFNNNYKFLSAGKKQLKL